MFNNPSIGPYIVIAHYLGAITVGILFRFLIGNDKTNYYRNYERTNIFKKAVDEMVKERQRDGRAFGKLLGDSVRESISTLVVVGGMIVTFSVLTRELYLIGFFNYLTNAASLLSIGSINIPSDMVEAILTGSIEITMGCKVTSEALKISPIMQITLATMIISWSGISVHAQAASIVNDTDINLNSYVLSKFFHSIISGIYAYIFLKLNNFKLDLIPKKVFSEGVENVFNYNWINRLIFSTNMFFIIFLTLIVVGTLIGILKKN
ncbi:hypothetical protein [Wukongibacter sp. M2B1]|uniref:hypothetical protein n=1 Tax=Wukongibacter sp. M2B1 TaxID=3088895 RepID=UPI003D7C067D